jgi:transcriptional regulator of arginine metabolism
MRNFRILMQSRTTAPAGQQARRQRILALVARQRIRSQAELQERLAAAGFEVNQATLSRDLRALSVVKSKDGYELPVNGALLPADQGKSLWHAVHSWLLSATPAQNLLVLKTPPGGAQPLGLAIDAAALPGIVGTIAGDDTVLTICADAGKARSLARRLLQMRGGDHAADTQSGGAQ